MGASADVNAASFEVLQQYIALEDSGRTHAVRRMWQDADRVFANLHGDLSGAEQRYLSQHSWQGEAANAFRQQVLQTRDSLASFQGDVVLQQLDLIASKIDWAKGRMAELQAQWNHQMAQASESHIGGMIGALYGKSSAPGMESYTISVAGHSFPVHVTRSAGQDTSAQQAQSKAGETQAQAHEIAQAAQQLIRDELTKQARFTMGQLASAYVDAGGKIAAAAATFNFKGPINAMASGLPSPGALPPGVRPGGSWPSGAPFRLGHSGGSGGPSSGAGNNHGGGAGQPWPDGAVRTGGTPTPQSGDPGQNAGQPWPQGAVNPDLGNGGNGFPANPVALTALTAGTVGLRGRGAALAKGWPRDAIGALRGTGSGSASASNVLGGTRSGTGATGATTAPSKGMSSTGAGFEEESPAMRPPVAPSQAPKGTRGAGSTVESARPGMPAPAEEPLPTLGGRRSAGKRGEREGTGKVVRIGARDDGQPGETIAPRIAGRTGEAAVTALRMHDLPGSVADPFHGATHEPEPSLRGHAGKSDNAAAAHGGASMVSHSHPAVEMSTMDGSSPGSTDLAGRARAGEAKVHLVLPTVHDATKIAGRLAGYLPVVPHTTSRRQRGSQQPVEVQRPEEESWTTGGGGKAVVDTPVTPEVERTPSPALGRAEA